MKFFNIRLTKYGLALAWIATVCGTQASDYAVGYNTQGITVYQGSVYDTQSAAVQNRTLVTERRTTVAATEAQANMVLSQIADRFDSRSGPSGNSMSLLPQQGGNAGAGDHRGSLWARAGYDNLKEDNITNFGGWKANLWSIALGYDYKFNDKVLAGAALTYSNLNGSTAFNRGNMRDNAYGIVPYMAFKVNPCFDIDMMIGYSRVNKNRDRTTPSLTSVTPSLSGVKATSSPKSDRYFAAIYANMKHHINQWNLLARLGYFYATDKQKSYLERNGSVNLNAVAAGLPAGVNAPFTTADKQYSSQTTNINRLSLRLQAGFKASPQVEPYAFLLYALDFGASKMKVQDTVVANTVGVTMPNPNRQRNNSTYGGGLGLNACLHSGWTTGIEGSYAQSKKFKDLGLQLRLAKKF